MTHAFNPDHVNFVWGLVKEKALHQVQDTVQSALSLGTCDPAFSFECQWQTGMLFGAFGKPL